MAEYTLENAPDDVLFDVNRHYPDSCIKCNSIIYVDIESRKVVVKN